ncbi:MULTISPECIES: CBS domain-containing protein [Pseudoalteromonas]|uniref:CBS domain-containing protein n=1 Tax=Pseudoalteromonas peptidolytica F12-50-A1 TaxID=1315280 RepID=A0A8I0N0G3_9GAMM|nr:MULTISPECIES: CBS domain-containing protein [Pseudoalteromonas]MBE0348460.1 hypothetical protein [Pseudoalteromonas peptidolytica F12-50-A1]MDW7549202.1 CBS domain-containing protein [Pseudoalteromonas peptidolytica]NLR15048.1 CBS domain-containing protein [Pseudoalteromonas peptidolytica]RRS07946.1 CBS domain-containing protein [Pseudoalteromonas sp. J010]RXF03307.1 CBS domain-containing protein [Pseudoalteromonas sp. PS5]
MGQYKALKTIKLQGEFPLCDHFDSEPLSLDSTALKVVTDFTRRQPQVISKDVDIDHALYMMKNGHVRSKLVVDDDDNFLGVVNCRDLSGRKVLSVAQRKQIPREEVCVEDVMTTKDDLHAVSYDVVAKSTIGDVLETLQQLGLQHVLLSGADGLRGMISASDIARALHIPVSILQKPTSFKEIFDVISGREDFTN